MSNMKAKDFRDGMRVTFNIFGFAVEGAVLVKNTSGAWCVQLGRFEWEVGLLKNLRPLKQSHHRKPSPESELVGSCTLLKKWRWRTESQYGVAFWTHRPEWCEKQLLWEFAKDTGYAKWWCGNLFPRIPANGLPRSQRLYRRQGDKWVHVGGK